MLPFRVFDKKEKSSWILLQYIPDAGDGKFLVAREDDSGKDGELMLKDTKELLKCRFVEFVNGSAPHL